MNTAPATVPAQNFSQLGYTAHRHDDDIGLINMNGRVYDITTRRFLTPDPVPDQPFTTFGTQPYSYVAHNPTNFTDPTGFYVGRDNRWYSQSLSETQEKQSGSQCPQGGACPDTDTSTVPKPSGDAEPGPSKELKAAYDRQWGGEEAAHRPDASSNDESGGRGQSGGMSWVTSGTGVQQLSIAQSGMVSPAGLGDLGGAMRYGSAQSPNVNSGNHLAAIPCPKSGCPMGSGADLFPGPGVVIGGGVKAVGAGVTLLQRLLRWVLGPAARALPTAAELLVPGGVRIGEAGASAAVRVLQGGEPAAQALFQKLAAGGTKFAGTYGERRLRCREVDSWAFEQ